MVLACLFWANLSPSVVHSRDDYPQIACLGTPWISHGLSGSDKRQSRQPKPGNSRDKAMTREDVRKRATVNDCSPRLGSPGTLVLRRLLLGLGGVRLGIGGLLIGLHQLLDLLLLLVGQRAALFCIG